MSVASAAWSPVAARPSPPKLALAVADANWFTTEHLFGELDQHDVVSLLLKCIDYRNAWQRGLAPWQWGSRLERRGDRRWQRDLVLPSGWMKQFPTWGMRPIGRTIRDWREQQADGLPLALVMTYPHYLYLRDRVRPEYQVYFNIDDYTQYWPWCADRVNQLERQAVREADLTVCVSRARVEQLSEAVPEAADRIRHLPHGAPEALLAPEPQVEPSEGPADLARLPRPWLGYVGSLEDRVDWPLLTRLSETYPKASIILVGRPPRRGKGSWLAEARECLARPNVHAIGWRDQSDIGACIRAFDVCLIPYLASHPFNRVCCPTKIMDYLASGRPVVSTDLPECRLYGQAFDVAEDDDGFVAAVGSLLREGPDDGRCAARHALAREHTCARMLERFLSWLPA